MALGLRIFMACAGTQSESLNRLHDRGLGSRTRVRRTSNPECYFTKLGEGYEPRVTSTSEKSVCVERSDRSGG
jgi:hypothetical protein